MQICQCNLFSRKPRRIFCLFIVSVLVSFKVVLSSNFSKFFNSSSFHFYFVIIVCSSAFISNQQFPSEFVFTIPFLFLASLGYLPNGAFAFFFFPQEGNPPPQKRAAVARNLRSSTTTTSCDKLEFWLIFLIDSDSIFLFFVTSRILNVSWLDSHFSVDYLLICQLPVSKF